MLTLVVIVFSVYSGYFLLVGYAKIQERYRRRSFIQHQYDLRRRADLLIVCYKLYILEDQAYNQCYRILHCARGKVV
jgi:hypothetical protein